MPFLGENDKFHANEPLEVGKILQDSHNRYVFGSPVTFGVFFAHKKKQ